MNGLFTDGWEDAAKFYVYDDSFNDEDLSANVEYTDEFDIGACRILYIRGYTVSKHKMTAGNPLSFLLCVNFCHISTIANMPQIARATAESSLAEGLFPVKKQSSVDIAITPPVTSGYCAEAGT